MKRPLGKLSFLIILLYLAACHKTAVSSNESAGIIGKWNLVSDSNYEGVGSSNHAVDYTGQPGDYFNFSSDGHVYTKEGFVPDVLTYTMVSNFSIIISDFGLILNGVQDTSTITGLAGNYGSGSNTLKTIVIESPWFPTPGGLFWRKVTLNR